MQFDFSAVLLVTNGSFPEGAVVCTIVPIAAVLSTPCVIYILRESDESSSPAIHFLFYCHVRNRIYRCIEVWPNLFSLSALWVNIVTPLWLLHLPSVWLKNIKPEEWAHAFQKCISISFSCPVLHWQLWGDGKDFVGPRSQCQRAGQRAVDTAARRRHLWPCRIGQNPYRPVSFEKALCEFFFFFLS